MSAIYLDCNATTPIDPEVKQLFVRYLAEVGNEGSRTHEFGARAKQVVQAAREQIAAVVAATRDEVIFTSGATESNNIAILGLYAAAKELGKTHIITSSIEHKAVLEPCRALERKGINITLLPVDAKGIVNPEAVRESLREDTFLVSIMQVNNETGVRQPLNDIACILKDHPAFLHTDAAQGFGKDIEPLRNSRIDLISISGHKIYAPQGIGALVMRKRSYNRPPLQPILYGGGQERALRSGTLPVALIAAFGAASEMAMRDQAMRQQVCRGIRKRALEALSVLNPIVTGEQSSVIDHVINLSFPGLDSEALIVALKDLIAISNGSACTSNSYSPSHVLKAMGMSDDEANSCVRISWCHLTPEVDWKAIANRIRKLR